MSLDLAKWFGNIGQTQREQWVVVPLIGTAHGPFIERDDAIRYSRAHGGKVLRMLEEN